MQNLDILQNIQSFLNNNGISYELLQHEPTPTSKDAAEIRGTSLNEGVKAIVVTTAKTKIDFMFCIPGNYKLKNSKIRDILDEDYSFSKREDLLKKYNFVVGGIPPFGFLFGIKTYVDQEIFKERRCAFNAGSTTISIVLNSKDYYNLRSYYILEDLIDNQQK